MQTSGSSVILMMRVNGEYGADLRAIVMLLNLLLKGTPYLFTCQQAGRIHQHNTSIKI